MSEKIAVVLMNLGGPSSLTAVKPFLFNLFYDRAIINLPNPWRWLIAKVISNCRAGKARKIYQALGGKSPLLANTNSQATALEQHLRNNTTSEWRVFVAMRYWHPLTLETVKIVKDYNPDKVILLPLYPQFSTTTTASSFKEWDTNAKVLDLHKPHLKISQYPTEDLFIRAYHDLIVPIYKLAATYAVASGNVPRVLFSAHSLPQKIIDAGDPYQRQIEQTATAIVEHLQATLGEKVYYQACYQSRVGPMKWLTPTTEQALRQAGENKSPVVVVPISFVSEHSETLIELDQDYKKLAADFSVPFYGRVPAVGCQPLFIEGLANLCKKALRQN